MMDLLDIVNDEQKGREVDAHVSYIYTERVFTAVTRLKRIWEVTSSNPAWESWFSSVPPDT
jgi:hypothetical protein